MMGQFIGLSRYSSPSIGVWIGWNESFAVFGVVAGGHVQFLLLPIWG